LGDQIEEKRDRLGMGEMENAYKILVRKSGKLKRRRKDNIKMYLKQTGRGYVDWSPLAQYRVR